MGDSAREEHGPVCQLPIERRVGHRLSLGFEIKADIGHWTRLVTNNNPVGTLAYTWVSAHFPSPSQTRTKRGKPSLSFKLPLSSSQMFSTEGYSRKSLRALWS